MQRHGQHRYSVIRFSLKIPRESYRWNIVPAPWREYLAAALADRSGKTLRYDIIDADAKGMN